MKKAEKGFTLIELMIVVAIIGILAAVAVPNFLRYQLRARFGEVQENVTSILKSEESLRQSERLVGGVSGLYRSLGLLPAGCLPSSTKRAWTTTDLKVAGTIDWVVEGSTYACYTTSTGNAPARPSPMPAARSASRRPPTSTATARTAAWRSSSRSSTRRAPS